MPLPVAPLCYGIDYTSTTARVSFFFSNLMRVTITFTLDKYAYTIEYSQWSDKESSSARMGVPELDQTVVIKDFRIGNVSGHPLQFHGHIDVSRRGPSDSVECWRSHIAMNIELPCSPPDESAIESGSESAIGEEVMILD
jgi:hypothetical protein